MPTPFTFDVPRPTGKEALHLEVMPGQSIIIIGANGAGKTRLGVYFEKYGPQESVHRIAAHKSLTLNTQLQLDSYERAERMLRTGLPQVRNPGQADHRFRRKPITNSGASRSLIPVEADHRFRWGRSATG